MSVNQLWQQALETRHSSVRPWYARCCTTLFRTVPRLRPLFACRYSEPTLMRFRFFIAACVLASVAVPASAADDREDAKAQVEFGIKVAQKGLWREAIYRWEKAVELDPSYAAAFNDLAIAYEHEGLLDKARKSYEKAVELEPNNAEIRQNFELFKEINDRTGSAKDKN